LSEKDLKLEIERLKRERDAYADALALSNMAFVDKVKEFSIIKRIAESIGWCVDKERICRELVDLIIDETTAENCSLWLVDSDHQNIVLSAVRGQENHEPRVFNTQDPETKRMLIGKGAAGWVAYHGNSLLIEDVSKSPYFVPMRDAVPAIQSLLCLPIKSRDRVLGVLNLSHPDIGAFSKENERVLALITDQAGIVFTNYFLFEETQELNRGLESKVEKRTRALKEREELFARAVNAGMVCVWDWEIGTDYLAIAQELQNVLGFQREDFKGLRCYLRLIHRDDRLKLMRGIQRCLQQPLTEPFYEGEHRIRHREGHEMWFLVRGSVVCDPSGQPRRFSGSSTDITKRKIAEIGLEKARKEALARAHKIGKAEFATTVLHNIGNVLSSVNVASTQMREIVNRSKLQNLSSGFQMIQENIENLADFFQLDQRGQMLPSYLTRACEMMGKDLDELRTSAFSITNKITLMRDIIETQQSLAKSEERLQNRPIPDLIEEALTIQSESLKRYQVKVKRAFKTDVKVTVPVARFLHVLINLFKNASEAMRDMPLDERVLRIEVTEERGSRIRLIIEDSGEGIDGHVIDQLFAHGFTTKEDGHGFGLHYCKTAIEEIGGTIEVTSDGKHCGATFSLSFPKHCKPVQAKPVVVEA
jgi:PAS domain S-box-containing protein